MKTKVMLRVTCALLVPALTAGVVTARARAATPVARTAIARIALSVAVPKPPSTGGTADGAAYGPTTDGPRPVVVAFPTTESPRPKPAEWKEATPLPLARASDPRCRATRIREWVRLECRVFGTSSTLIAGGRAGVGLWLEETGAFASFIELPVRRGDRRIFQLNGSAGRYGEEPVAIVSEQWVDGEAAPIITVTTAR
jgi:hypothetical protein